MDVSALLDSPGSTYVWAFHKAFQEWCICRVVSNNGVIESNNDTLQVYEKRKKETFTVKKSDVCLLDPTHLQDLNDLSSMNNLHEAPLINILR